MLLKIRLLLNDNKFFITIICIFSMMIISVMIFLILITFKQKALLVETNSARLKHENFVMEIKKVNIEAFENTLNKSFEASLLAKRAQAKFTYILMINGKKVTTNNIISSKTPSITMQLFENFDKVDLEILPKTIIESGSILNENSKSTVIKISSDNSVIKTKLVNTQKGNSILYEFSNVKNGEIITIEIESKIAKKIGLSVNIIEIIYN